MKYKHTVVEWWYDEIKEKMENYVDYKIVWIIHHWWFIQVFMEKEITDEEYEKEAWEAIHNYHIYETQYEQQFENWQPKYKSDLFK